MSFYQYMSIEYSNTTTVRHEYPKFEYYSHTVKRNIYTNGLLDFYKRTFDPNMTVLKMKNIIDGIDFFEIVDSLNCWLKEVDVFDCENGTLFHYLSRSGQSNYTQIIKLLDIQLGTPSILKSMVALTKLELTYTDNRVDISLTDDLNGCLPFIKSLSIACTRLLVDASNTQVSPIQVLEIRYTKV